MEALTKTKPKKKGVTQIILDETARLIAHSLKNKGQGTFSISGLDTTSTTYLIAKLGTRIRKIQFVTYSNQGIQEIDGALFYETAAKSKITTFSEPIIDRLKDISPQSGKYLEIHGGDNQLRELALKIIYSKLKIPVYVGSQFPRSTGLETIDLDQL